MAALVLLAVLGVGVLALLRADRARPRDGTDDVAAEPQARRHGLRRMASGFAIAGVVAIVMRLPSFGVALLAIAAIAFLLAVILEGLGPGDDGGGGGGGPDPPEPPPGPESWERFEHDFWRHVEDRPVRRR